MATDPTVWPKANFALIASLTDKPHPLLNIADDFEKQIREIPLAWVGEVFQHSRNAHHLLDIVGVPHGQGYASDLDARTWQAVNLIAGHRNRLDRIASWHSRETAVGGMVGDYCVECGNRWPCETRRMADGTHEDFAESDATRPAAETEES